MKQLALDVRLPRAGLDWHAQCELPAYGVTGVFGPSGSGKTTLLRCIAGLERGRGFVRLGEAIWQDDSRAIWRDAAQRGVGMVFQDARLFPHLSVRGNLQYGFTRTPASQRQVQWPHALHVFGLDDMLHRRVGELSAGEQQRVAMARALLSSPSVLLMDEPLAALDVRRKREILPFIRRAAREFNIPVLLVSHTLQELLQVADALLLLDRGNVIAAGEINEVLMRLHLLGYGGDHAGTVLETRVLDHEPHYQLTVVEFHGHRLYVPYRDIARGEALRVFVLARNVSLAMQPVTAAFSVLNTLEATVVEVRELQGGSGVVDVRLDIGAPLLASITRKSVDQLQLQPGQRVYAYIKAVALEQEL